MTKNTATPWGGLLQAALRLGVSPYEFWQLSLREWQLISGTRKVSGFRSSDLSRLISAFPDKE